MILFNYENLGYDTYRLNVGSDACNECKAHSEEYFLISKLKDAEAFPLVHPNCRCEIEILDKAENVVATVDNKSADEEVKSKSSHSISVLDYLSNLLTAASLIPWVDTFADLAAIPVDLLRGDFLSAGLDFIGAIPLIGEVADTAKIAKAADKAVDAGKVINKTDDMGKAFKKVSLPTDNSQLKHIFGNRKGHLPDTPSNRKLLLDTANEPKYYRGTDKYGNKWNINIDDEGRQIWTSSQNGRITEGGRNDIPREWDKDTGLNNNPFKTKKRRK